MYKKIIAVMLTIFGMLTVTMEQNTVRANTNSVVQSMTLGQNGIVIKNDMTRIASSSTLKLAVWSVENGQDDLHWYTVNANGILVVPYKNHKGYGKYEVHVYQDTKGAMTGLENQVFTMPQPNVHALMERINGSSVTLTVKNVPAYIESIVIPVWSDENGQDDIMWYTATKVTDGHFQLVIDAKNHQYTTGKYHVNIYGVNALNNGKSTYIRSTSGFMVRDVPIQAGTITVGDLENLQLNLPVTVTQAYHRDGLKNVRIAVWSDKDGQDDIVWYVATKESDGNYRLNVPLSKHSKASDRFHFHVYYQSMNDKMVFLGSKQSEITFPELARTTVTLTDNGLLIQVDPRLVQNGKVQAAIWSEVNSQDDLRWYEVDLSGQLNVSLGNHSGYGKYNIHVYQDVSGNMQHIDTPEFTLSKPTAITTIERQSTTVFQINVTNVPTYIEHLKIPVWSDSNGQDDVVWYTATKTGQGSFTLSVDVRNHLLSSGKYYVHLYGASRFENGKLVNIANHKGFVADNLPVQSGEVTVEAFNSTNFTLPVQVTQAAHQSGIKSVKIAVWTDKNGQDDIVWYTASKQSNSHYRLQIPVVNHGIVSDTYHIHTYYELNNGNSIGISSEKRYITLPAISKLAASIEGLGGFSPSLDIRNRLADEITRIHNQSYKVGFVMYDVKTKKGIAYNPNERFYSASTIKGPYVSSLAEQQPSATTEYYNTIRGVLTYSSNDGYHLLRSVYGSGYLSNWMSQSGVDTSLAPTWYPYISANELAKLWERSYQFFTGSSNGNQVGGWFENPNLSPIYKALPHRTKSKAGWIGEPGYHAANDGGIVHSPHGDYIIVITSNADGKLSLLEGIIRLLDEAYTDMKTR